jgi:hypothetical protein
METTESRFWSKVAWRSETGCLEWIGAIGWTMRDGKYRLPYGRFYWNSRLGMAHHYAYERIHGHVPLGLEIDHLCRNPRCVNVEHLEAVTRLENIRRSKGISVHNASKTHCPQGHLYDEDNTLRAKNGARLCRRCNAERMRRERDVMGIPRRPKATDTHCANGHAWADNNERFVSGKRVCRTCSSAATLRARKRKRTSLKG